MKWNDRVSDRRQRYVDYLNKIPQIHLLRLIDDMSDENNQYIHSDGHTILWTYIAYTVKITCETQDEFDFLNSTCNAIVRDRKITQVLA